MPIVKNTIISVGVMNYCTAAKFVISVWIGVFSVWIGFRFSNIGKTVKPVFRKKP